MPKPPIAPHLEHREPLGPDHQLPSGRFRRIQLLAMALISGTLVAAIIGLILGISGVKIDVILPVLAPIWVGTITLVYSTNIHR